jgi:hypothetical protein
MWNYYDYTRTNNYDYTCSYYANYYHYYACTNHHYTCSYYYARYWW